MSKILLIRHALTDHVGKYLSGRSPGIHLNDEGRKQAVELGKRLSKTGLSAIYCSPADRAVETGREIAARSGLSLNISPEFNEIDFGDWTGQSIEYLRSDPIFRRFNTFRSCTRIPGGELMSEAQMRIISGIEKLTAEFPEVSIAIVSHSDIIKSAISHYAGINLDMIHRFEISPASVSIVNITKDAVRITLLNSVQD